MRRFCQGIPVLWAFDEALQAELIAQEHGYSPPGIEAHRPSPDGGVSLAGPTANVSVTVGVSCISAPRSVTFAIVLGSAGTTRGSLDVAAVGIVVVGSMPRAMVGTLSGFVPALAVTNQPKK